MTSAFDISSVKSATGRLEAHAEVRGHAERERRLPHRRARREDHEVARLEARREPVEVAEAARDAGDVDAGLVELRDPLEALGEERADVREVAADPLLGEVEDDLLGPVDELGRLADSAPAEPRDLLARLDEPAERRGLLDDPRVVVDVRRRRDERRELGDPRAAADLLELAALLELVRERDRVDRARPSPRARGIAR